LREDLDFGFGINSEELVPEVISFHYLVELTVHQLLQSSHQCVILFSRVFKKAIKKHLPRLEMSSEIRNSHQQNSRTSLPKSLLLLILEPVIQEMQQKLEPKHLQMESVLNTSMSTLIRFIMHLLKLLKILWMEKNHIMSKMEDNMLKTWLYRTFRLGQEW